MKDMATCPYPKLLADNTGASSSIEFLSQKYKECYEKHIQCRVWQSDVQFHPTRLIDVGALGDGHVRLRDMRSYGGQGPYFCLSHCWGKKQPFKLTKETFSALQEGISLGCLPKTFRDAILVTRNFQVRYLWYVISVYHNLRLLKHILVAPRTWGKCGMREHNGSLLRVFSHCCLGLVVVLCRNLGRWTHPTPEDI
jgi:hypothetical protein